MIYTVFRQAANGEVFSHLQEARTASDARRTIEACGGTVLAVTSYPPPPGYLVFPLPRS